MGEKWKRICEKCETRCGVDNHTGRMHWICRCPRDQAVPFTDEEMAELEKGIAAQLQVKSLKLTETTEQSTITLLTADLDDAQKTCRHRRGIIVDLKYELVEKTRRIKDASDMLTASTAENERLREALIFNNGGAQALYNDIGKILSNGTRMTKGELSIAQILIGTMLDKADQALAPTKENDDE